MQYPSRINLIAALGTRTRAIGKDNTLLWQIPGDLAHFKKLTTGHPIVMGSTTFASIGRPLPGRTNIVITHDRTWTHDDVAVYHSIPEALAAASAEDPEDVFVIGGGMIYKQTLDLADRLYLTLVDDDIDGDTFFPDYTTLPFTETAREACSNNGLHWAWVTLERTQ